MSTNWRATHVWVQDTFSNGLLTELLSPLLVRLPLLNLVQSDVLHSLQDEAMAIRRF